MLLKSDFEHEDMFIQLRITFFINLDARESRFA